ncbi:MAG: metallophosphoesterase [Phycisphaerales bacterium]|nr:metallophosphoesterase [Phycisphaerales bacterium]
MTHHPRPHAVALALSAAASIAAWAPPAFCQLEHPEVLDQSRFQTSRAVPILPVPGEEDSFFFVVYGDRTGGPAEGIEVLKDAVRDTNLLEPDLVMTVGDLVQGYNTTEQWTIQMREFKGVMDALLCPWFPVSGNHDIYWRGTGKPAGEHESDYEANFGPLWYAFEHKNSVFIALYSDEGNPETGEKAINKPDCQKMSPEQFEWLRKTLQESRDAEHIFLFLHHPRWLRGGYGDDWDKVHELLVQAGNVTAVFAGHIHRARFDQRDNIQYVTLATVGGEQSGKAPEAGYLHHFDIVTVRAEHIALASIPVGAVQDVRAITGQVSDECGRLADVKPSIAQPLQVSSSGLADGMVRVEVANPVSRPVEVEVRLESTDSRWASAPDHAHATIAPGQSKTFEIAAGRAEGLDAAFRPLEVVVGMDYLAEQARFGIPEVRAAVPLSVDIAAPVPPGREVAADLDGVDDFIRVENASVPLPDGPLTLECWMRARSFGDRVGLIAKTESSDYGIFVNKGEAHFSVFLDAKYATARSEGPALKVGQWHHVAGVFDGAEVRLYIDGKLISTTKSSGKRKTNNLPLMIGADVNGRAEPVSFFDGEIDGVRLSKAAVYSGPSFDPPRRPAPTADTMLLLNMDGAVGPWLFDESGRGAHPVVEGRVNLVGVD